MKYYEVNGIQFGFSYHFTDFFENNIEKYEIDDCEVEHHIETKMVQSIVIPSDIASMKFHNREVYINDHGEQVYVYDKGFPVLMIETDKEYKRSTLSIVEGMNGASEIEYVYTGILFMELCLYHSIVSLHGAAIALHDQIIIFSGPSGTGKSTHVEYWKEIEPLFEIINDDKPLLHLERGEIIVSGSPWSGKTKGNSNVSFPLHSIVFLSQGTSNKIVKLTEEQKMIHIMRNINRPRQNELWENVSDVIESMIKDVPMYQASITKNVDAAIAVKKALGV